MANPDISSDELAMIDFIRYTGVFNELILRKGLSLKSKPPALYSLCKLSKKIGTYMPNTYQDFMHWSCSQSPYKIPWEANLVCSIGYNCDGIKLTPEDGTTQYHTFVVHKELFMGFG